MGGLHFLFRTRPPKSQGRPCVENKNSLFSSHFWKCAQNRSQWGCWRCMHMYTRSGFHSLIHSMCCARRRVADDGRPIVSLWGHPPWLWEMLPYVLQSMLGFCSDPDFDVCMRNGSICNACLQDILLRYLHIWIVF